MVAVARLCKTADSFDATGAKLQQKPFLLLLFTYWPLKKVKVKLPIRDRGPFSDAASFVGEDEDCKCVSRCPTKYPEKEIKSCISAPHIPHFSPTSSILQ